LLFATADCLLLTADCLLNLRRGDLAGPLARAKVYDKMSLPTEEDETCKFKKLNEQCGNVYENKGPALRIAERSGNPIENTGTYSLKAGTLLKRKGLRTWPF
jgi:hypothetical protein